MNLMMRTRQSEDTGTKTGMGWMRTGVPCLCHTVQTSVASLKRVSCQRLQVSQLQSSGILTTTCIMMQQADMCQRQVTLLFSETE